MKREYVRAKIHRTTVTGTDIGYEGSITIDRELLEAAEIHPHERVQVVNCTNGERLETYAIPGEEGVIRLNGAAGRLTEPGDIIIILCYAIAEDTERPVPRVVHVDENNDILDVETGFGTGTGTE